MSYVSPSNIFFFVHFEDALRTSKKAKASKVACHHGAKTKNIKPSHEAQGMVGSLISCHRKALKNSTKYRVRLSHADQFLPVTCKT